MTQITLLTQQQIQGHSVLGTSASKKSTHSDEALQFDQKSWHKALFNPEGAAPQNNSQKLLKLDSLLKTKETKSKHEIHRESPNKSDRLRLPSIQKMERSSESFRPESLGNKRKSVEPDNNINSMQVLLSSVAPPTPPMPHKALFTPSNATSDSSSKEEQQASKLNEQTQSQAKSSESQTATSEQNKQVTDVSEKPHASHPLDNELALNIFQGELQEIAKSFPHELQGVTPSPVKPQETVNSLTVENSTLTQEIQVTEEQTKTAKKASSTNDIDSLLQAEEVKFDESLQVSVERGPNLPKETPIKTNAAPEKLAENKYEPNYFQAFEPPQTAAAAPQAADETPSIKNTNFAKSVTPDSTVQEVTAEVEANNNPSLKLPSETIGAPSSKIPVSTQPSSPLEAKGLPPMPIFSTEANQQVAMHLRQAALEGQNRFTIQLTPLSLGQVQIDMKIAEDGKIMAVIAAERGETLDLLQKDVNQLEKVLRDAGLSPDSQSLSFNLMEDSSNNHKQNQQQKEAYLPTTILASKNDQEAGSIPSIQTPPLVNRWFGSTAPQLNIEI